MNTKQLMEWHFDVQKGMYFSQKEPILALILFILVTLSKMVFGIMLLYPMT